MNETYFCNDSIDFKTIDLFIIIIPFMTLNILQHGMRYAFNLAIQIFLRIYLFSFLYHRKIQFLPKWNIKICWCLKWEHRKKRNILWSSNNKLQHTTYNNITRETLEEFSRTWSELYQWISIGIHKKQSQSWSTIMILKLFLWRLLISASFRRCFYESKSQDVIW